MPGVIPHLIAGCVIFFISRYYFRNYFRDKRIIQHLLLLCTSLVCSIIPDFFLGIHFVTHLICYEFLAPYQELTHLIIAPIAISLLLIVKYRLNLQKEPIWITCLCAIIFHIIMDLIIPDTSYLI